jgi:hypothetical protein
MGNKPSNCGKIVINESMGERVAHKRKTVPSAANNEESSQVTYICVENGATQSLEIDRLDDLFAVGHFKANNNKIQERPHVCGHALRLKFDVKARVSVGTQDNQSQSRPAPVTRVFASQEDGIEK